MASPGMRPEPPDGSYLVVGRWPSLDVLVRRDDEAERRGYGDRRWFAVGQHRDVPLRYADLTGPAGRLYRQDELDAAVAEARGETEVSRG